MIGKKLFRKIVFSCVILAVMLVGLSVYSVKQLRVVGGYFDQADAQAIEPFQNWAQYKLAAMDLKGLLVRHTAETDPARCASIEEKIRARQREIAGLFESQKNAVVGNGVLMRLTPEEQKGLEKNELDISKKSPDYVFAVLQCYHNRLNTLTEAVIKDSNNFMKQDAQDALDSGEGFLVFGVIDRVASMLSQRACDEVEAFQTKSLEVRNIAENNVIVACVIGEMIVASISLLLVLLAKNILGPLTRGIAFANAIASGDLTQHLEEKRRDEVGELTHAMNRMASSLKAIFFRIGSVAAEVEVASEQQAAGAANQATATAQMAGTAGELLATARQLTQNGVGVSEQAEMAARECADSTVGIDDTVQSIGGIRQRVEKITEHMMGLSDKSQQINGVLDIITDMSDQTNLLSLNASIEAAGAGEAGKRFAVVAGEIRKLAERAAASTTEIRGLIQGVQETVNTTIMATEEGTKAVEEGVRHTGELKGAFERIANQVASTAESAKVIEMASMQQVKALEQVDEAVRSIDSTARQSETAAKQVRSEVQALAETARRFRVEPNEAHFLNGETE